MAGRFQTPGLAGEPDRSARRTAQLGAKSRERQIRAEAADRIPASPAVGGAQAEDRTEQARAAARIVELEAVAKSLEQRLAESEGRMADHAYRVLTARLERQRFSEAAAQAEAAVEVARAEIEAAHDTARAEIEAVRGAARSALCKAEEDRNAALKALIETSSAKGELEAERDRLNNHIRRQERTLNAILASRSWRAMEPVRKLTTFARRMRHSAGAFGGLVARIFVEPFALWFRRSILRRPA